MKSTPELTTPEAVQRRAGYQSLQPVQRPPYWGVDLDPARRPGVPMMRTDPQPFPHTRYPPEPQPGEPASPLHGRPNKTMPPVFGTAVPLRGLSGWVRKLAYRAPDHSPSHWLLMLLGDRVEFWGYRARRYLPVVVPLAAAVLLLRRARA
ncbi:hypothetical protein SAMN05444354_110251 [Stigmatella aurantiaca]|uniref:Uncharacterized protein n=1 Tax=Stigmatella aurantiaca TaxID=41 RepID=A0A1H7UZ39_STIAU|nr:hypothetical protein [Stigmatella aurantiaca]SEM01908.1 hypothetical protein SAMN05444354_110251 [Stigmatella aurantiaca]